LQHAVRHHHDRSLHFEEGSLVKLDTLIGALQRFRGALEHMEGGTR
jgi:hypothetical protein